MRPLAAVWLTAPFCVLFVTGCERPGTAIASVKTLQPQPVAPADQMVHRVRATGTVKAVRSITVVVPAIYGQGGRQTLVRMAPNGSRVNEGDVIAEFDRVQQLDAARDAKAKYEDLSHQVDQRNAQNQADAAKRATDLKRAEADLAKAELELSKAETLSEIERLKNETKAEDARRRVASLKKSGHFHDLADAAALKILELQRDRQKVATERSTLNAEKLLVRAPLGGMVAQESTYRNGSMGHAQEGDQLWSGQPLLRIFDPSEMEVEAQIGEPDGAVLVPGRNALIRLDAYPELLFHARLESASPVASSGLQNPIKTFTARFQLLERDPHLLPDLSASVVMDEQPAESSLSASRRTP